MADVFISYAHKDRESVDDIANGLNASGHSLWWDPALKAGDNYAQKIEKEIASAKGVVVCWSKHARDSLWVRAEATEALDFDKLVQLKLDDSRLPLPFNIIQMVSFANWDGSRNAAEWRTLDREIGAKTGRDPTGSTPQTEGDAPPELKQWLQGLAPVAMAGIGLTLLTALIALATIMLGEEMVDLGLYRTLALSGFGAATLGAILVSWRFARTVLATRRS